MEWLGPEREGKSFKMLHAQTHMHTWAVMVSPRKSLDTAVSVHTASPSPTRSAHGVPRAR